MPNIGDFTSKYPRARSKEANASRARFKGNDAAVRSRQEIADVNDIFPVPECINPERKEACRFSFKLFCDTYFTQRFRLRWAQDHLNLISTMENSVLRTGGQICYAFPRGMGKTSLAEALIIWSLLYAHRRYAVVVAGKASLADSILKAILQEFDLNDVLFEDFPEVCYPVRCVEGHTPRSRSQNIQGERTRWECIKGILTLPVIEGSEFGGSIIQCFGITGQFRGLKHSLPTGEIIRPDLVLIDDPQSDKSAKSESTTSMRERTINGTIRGLAGPDTSITTIMPCTVIRTNDLAERFLDTEKRPEWQGQRIKLLKKFPDNMDLWNEYNSVRKQGYQARLGPFPSMEFYLSNKEELDKGAEVSWTDRFDRKKEHSAIQAAMNLFYEDPLTFASEYQNEPLIESSTDVGTITLTREDVLAKTCGLPYRVVPSSTLYTTTGIDVQKRILYYLTVAWTDDFGGCIVDYGTYPKQPSFDGWVSSNPTIPLGLENKSTSVGPNIYAGLCGIRDHILSMPLRREGTEETVYVNRTLIDAGWSESTESVFNFCRDSNAGTPDRFLPSIGRGVSATMIPMMEWQLKSGEIRKWNSRILPQMIKSAMGRHASFDGNMWKTLLSERLLTPIGESNALCLHGPEPSYHDSLANHFTTEEGKEKFGRGRRVKEWVLKEGKIENHWWDCLTMSAVAANLIGLDPHTKTISIGELQYTAPTPKKVRKTLDLSRLPKVEA